jgi:proline iminopeptidase
VDYKVKLHEIHIPVLICVGKFDPQTPIVMNQELHDGISNSELVIFDNSGHSPFIEEEAKFIQVVQPFLYKYSTKR